MQLGLIDYVNAVSPLDPPRHLAPIADILEEAEHTGDVRAVIACPPQHGKTTLALHALVWSVLRHPERSHAYISYSASIAEEKLYQARMIAERSGIMARYTASHWSIEGGGAVRAIGVQGPLTGHPVDGLMIIDDYVKNRLEAESETWRRRTYTWFTSAAMTRLHPGASCIVICTRWHPDDLGGQLIRDGWRSVILPAIDDDGNPLWPAKRPLEFLLKQRRQIGEHDWWALYQGQPRPREGALFRGVATYAIPPAEGRTVIGLDFAYSAKRTSDYSAAVVLRAHEGRYYVLEAVKQRASPLAWVARLRALAERYPRAEVVAGISSTERGMTALLREHGIQVHEEILRGDKAARAHLCAADWEAGRILMPERNENWADQLLQEILQFTGSGQEHDDQVDALVVAHGRLRTSSSTAMPAVSGRLVW